MCCRDIEPETPPKSLPTARPYGELSAAAQAEARDYWREQGWTWSEHDSAQLTETFQDRLWEQYGIEGADVSWSLGWCQGDGVSFAATPAIRAMAEHDHGLEPYPCCVVFTGPGGVGKSGRPRP